jgi:hypothetical protein
MKAATPLEWATDVSPNRIVSFRDDFSNHQTGSDSLTMGLMSYKITAC